MSMIIIDLTYLNEKNMKLRTATLLAIFGLIIRFFGTIIYMLRDLEYIKYINDETSQPFWYYRYLNALIAVGYALLMPFFINLYNNQKK